MGSATILTPSSTGLSGILLSARTNIPENQNMKKILTLYYCTGRSFTNSTWHNDSRYDLLIIWENGSSRNRENLQYKTVDSVLLSLFIKTNGK